MSQSQSKRSSAVAELPDIPPALPGSEALAVLEALPEWGPLVTIVLHGGCVFEFKGPFPRGTVGRGYLNLDGPVPGFHGHLSLAAIDHIGFQDRPHAGRPAYALTFNDAAGQNLFKVFLGRDEQGQHWPEQLARFEALRLQADPQRLPSPPTDRAPTLGESP